MRLSRAVLVRATSDDIDTVAWIHHVARNAFYAGDRNIPATGRPARQLHEFWYEQVSAPDPSGVMLAKLGEEPVGVVAYGPTGREALELRSLWVLPHFLGRGTGTLLHSVFVTALRASGRGIGTLEVWEGNVRARRFYERLGWRRDGRSRPGPQQSAYIGMVLDLAGDGPGGGTDAPPP